MRLALIAILAVALSSCAIQPQPVSVAILTDEIAALKKAMDRHEAVLEQALGVIQCESGGRHEIWGDVQSAHPAYGIIQAQKRTFRWLADEKMGRPELKWGSRGDQVTLLIWAIENGYGNYWVCFRRLRG